MKWEARVKKRPYILTATFNSAEPYDGPGRILTAENGAMYLDPMDGRELFGPLMDGDYITLQERGERQIVGYQTKARLDEHYERALELDPPEAASKPTRESGSTE